MTTKQQVADIYSQHPNWTSRQMADALGCLPEYVRTTLKRLGLKLAVRPAIPRPDVVRERERCAALAEAAGRPDIAASIRQVPA